MRGLIAILILFILGGCFYEIGGRYDLEEVKISNPNYSTPTYYHTRSIDPDKTTITMYFDESGIQSLAFTKENEAVGEFEGNKAIHTWDRNIMTVRHHRGDNVVFEALYKFRK